MPAGCYNKMLGRPAADPATKAARGQPTLKTPAPGGSPQPLGGLDETHLGTATPVSHAPRHGDCDPAITSRLVADTYDPCHCICLPFGTTEWSTGSRQGHGHRIELCNRPCPWPATTTQLKPPHVVQPRGQAPSLPYLTMQNPSRTSYGWNLAQTGGDKCHYRSVVLAALARALVPQPA